MLDKHVKLKDVAFLPSKLWGKTGFITKVDSSVLYSDGVCYWIKFDEPLGIKDGWWLESHWYGVWLQEHNFILIK